MNHLTVTQPPSLAALWADTQAANFAMASEPQTGQLLRTLAASKPGGRLLEIGTGTGLSTAWLLDGMDASAHLTSLDSDADVLDIAQKHLGQDQRLTLQCAEGDAWLLAQPRNSFDLIFADAWPGKYHLLDETLALLKPGGLYVVDDLLPQPNWPQGHDLKAAALMQTLTQVPHHATTTLAWASGIVLVARLN